MSVTNQALAAHLLEYSVKLGSFTLKSGRTSNWFIDAKQTICRPDGLLLVADALLAGLPGGTTSLGGLTMGADPVAFGVAGVATARGRALRAFSVRKETKDHGAGGRLAGVLEPGDRVVITEDAVTRGTSILGAVQVVRALGAEVLGAVAVVDRAGTCGALLEPAGVPFAALVTAPELGFAYEGAG